MSQTLFRKEFTFSTSSVTAVNNDIVLTTIDGLSYSNFACVIKYKILANVVGGASTGSGYLECTYLLESLSGTVQATNFAVDKTVGALGSGNVSNSVTGGNAARLTVTPPSTSAMIWYIIAEVYQYDSGI